MFTNILHMYTVLKMKKNTVIITEKAKIKEVFFHLALPQAIRGQSQAPSIELILALEANSATSLNCTFFRTVYCSGWMTLRTLKNILFIWDSPEITPCVPGISHAPCTDFGKRPKPKNT